MTPLTLQNDIKKRIKSILTDKKFMNTSNEMVDMNIYIQNLPHDADSEYSKAPYVLIKLLDGTGIEEPTANIAIIILTYDENENYQGYQDSLLIIEDIKTEILKKRRLNNFELDNLRWYPHDENTFPFYFGIIETEWRMPEIKDTSLNNLI